MARTNHVGGNAVKSDMKPFVANSKTRRRTEQTSEHGTIRASLTIDNGKTLEQENNL